MDNPLFLELEFWALLLCSTFLPAVLLIWMTWKRVLSKYIIISIGFFLIFLAGIDAFLLGLLSVEAEATKSILDDKIFHSELSIALYIVPLVLAKIGVSLITHVLCNHISILELHPEHDKDLP